MNVTPIGKAQRARREAVKLTAAKVRGLKPREKLYQVADAETRGLVVRVQPSGVKTYYVTGLVGGGRGAPRRNVRIGAADQVALVDARAEARQITAALARGEDPDAPQPGSTLLRELVDQYAQRLESRGVVKRADVIRSLEFNLNKYTRQPIGDLTRQKVVAEVDAIERDGPPRRCGFSTQKRNVAAELVR